MKRVLVILLGAVAISAFAADATVKGYLVDISCATDEGLRPDFGTTHTKECLKMPECESSGYGVLTADKKIIKFDKAGNEQARKFLDSTTRNADIKVIVTGTVSGDSMTVSKIELQ